MSDTWTVESTLAMIERHKAAMEANLRHLGIEVPRIANGVGPPPADEMVWIGDLSGFRVEADHDGCDRSCQPDHDVLLTHRCGWEHRLHPADQYLGNIAVKCQQHRAEGCR